MHQGTNDNSPSKNDMKDLKTIAMLVKDGRYRDVYIPENLYQELRETVSEHERIHNQQGDINNQVIRCLDIRFPEFSRVFKAWGGMAALMLLKNYPTPAKVIGAGVDGIMSIWRQTLKKPSQKRAKAIINAAKESIGRKTGSVAAEASIRNLLNQYELLMKQL